MAKDATESAAMAYKEAASGVFVVPTGFTATTMTFKVSDAIDGTFTALYNTSNSAVSYTVAAGRAYPIPTEAAGAAYIKFVGNTGQLTAAKTITVTTKS